MEPESTSSSVADAAAKRVQSGRRCADTLAVMRGLGICLASACTLALVGGTAAATDASARAPAQSQELLVRFEPGAAERLALAAADAVVVERLPVDGLVRVRVDDQRSLAAADAALERRADVVYSEPNRTYRLFATPDDPMFGSLWGLQQIDAPEAWDIATGSDSVTVAVVDSGVDYNHPDLLSNRWTNAAEVAGTAGVDDDANGRIDDLYGWDFFANDASPVDQEGHGTHVAGTIGARGNNAIGVAGVSWQPKLMALRAGNAQLGTAAIVNAFVYACSKGAKIVNGSFGTAGPMSAAMHDAIASCPNTLFVFAAGNGGADGVGDSNDLAPVQPCNDPSPNVICVAASNPLDALPSFSNFGVLNVDLAAPGEGIDSTYLSNGYATRTGTSTAAPHVAGAAAVVASHRPDLSVPELRRALLLSAEPKPGLAGRVATGGRLNLRRALAQEIAPPTGLRANSPSHPTGAWSNDRTVDFSWSGAVDASGIDGYSFVVSPIPAFVPDAVKDAEETTTSMTLSLDDGTHWFHIRAVDAHGNWGDAVHVGPISIDSFQPVRPGLSSPSHRVGGASTDRTVEVAWTGALDSASGLDGYSFSWSQTRPANPDGSKDVEATVTRATSAPLAPGIWWFNLRARDNAGNLSDTVSLGPLSIRTVPPTCSVPRLRGLRLAAARSLLTKRGCALGRITRTRSRRVARGRVVAQRPAPGLRLRRGARVAVSLSRGRR